LAQRLGERLIPSALELSGCDAMFVFADANVEMAARAAWYGATLNEGRTCMATRRVFVQRGVWEKFVAVLATLSPGGRGVGGEGARFDGRRCNADQMPSAMASHSRKTSLFQNRSTSNP
jgi:acyl-CoA reductase-like NAD-dependent aldehyde dehydrogenase